MIDNLSGHHGISAKLKELGYQPDKIQLQRIIAEVTSLAEKKPVSESELSCITGQIMENYHKLYRLGGFHAHIDYNGGIGHSVSVDLIVDDKIVSSRGTGDGVLEAIFKAIQSASGLDFELIDYKLISKSIGINAMAEAIVTLELNGTPKKGIGCDTDVTRASALAFIKAMNLLS